MSEAKCSSCGAAIQWVKTAAGKSMPLVPKAGGNINIINGQAHVGGVGHGTHQSHFADCPNAAKHRKPTQGALEFRE